MSVYYAYLVSHFPPEVNQRGLTDLGYYDETCYYETPGGPLVSEVGYHPRKKIHA